MILLSGIGGNTTAWRDFAYAATTNHESMVVDVTNSSDPDVVKVEFIGSHRHMKLMQPSTNISLEFRFTGNVAIDENHMGKGLPCL